MREGRESQRQQCGRNVKCALGLRSSLSIGIQLLFTVLLENASEAKLGIGQSSVARLWSHCCFFCLSLCHCFVSYGTSSCSVLELSCCPVQHVRATTSHSTRYLQHGEVNNSHIRWLSQHFEINAFVFEMCSILELTPLMLHGICNMWKLTANTIHLNVVVVAVVVVVVVVVVLVAVLIVCVVVVVVAAVAVDDCFCSCFWSC